MRRALIVLMTVVGLVVASPAMADTKTVQITRNAFVPARISVAAGDTVTWRNVDSRTHQVVANNGSFASLALKTNETFSQTFTTPGTVGYHDADSTARGSVLVTAVTPPPTATVTLTSDRTSVIYNGAVVLRGNVSTGVSGETVALNTQQAGDVKVAQAVDTTQTGPGGAFMFTVHPNIRTSYEAAFKLATSQPVTVYVAPRITLTRSANGIFHTTAISDQSYRGHFVLLQQRRGFGAWVTVRKIFLGSRDSASFRMRFRHGRTFVRIWMTAPQAGFGYIAGHSGAWLVRR
jgi:plastocyanin